MNKVDYSQNFYKLADLCTQEANNNAHQELNDTRLEKIESTIKELFTNTYDLSNSSLEEQQSAYVLAHRIRDLHKSLKGESPKVDALKTELKKVLDAIYSTLPVGQPPSPLLKMSEDMTSEFLKQFPADSKEEIKKFIDAMKLIYQRRDPEVFVKMISTWVDMHKVPIANLPLSYEHILEILPHLHYVDLSGLIMMDFGFAEEQCKEKYCLLIEALGQPVNLSLAGGLVTLMHYPTNDHSLSQPQTIPLDDAVFQKICEKKSLQSLNLSCCQVAKGNEIELLNTLPKLNSLNIYGLWTPEVFHRVMTDETLPLVLNLKVSDLVIPTRYLTNEGLKKLAACNQFKNLELFFHEEMKEHSLDCFKDLSNLSSLTIHEGFAFKDADFQFLENLVSLKEVCLPMCYRLSNAVVSKLKSQNIQKLSFSSASEISCSLIKENKALANTLEVLELNQCSKIIEGSLEPLKGLSCLHTLVLENSFNYEDNYSKKVGTATLEALLPLAEIASLKHLVIKKCSKLTDDEIVILKKALSHLETFTFEQ